MMQRTLSALALDRSPQAANVLACAFQEDPVISAVLVYARPDRRFQALRALLPVALKCCCARGKPLEVRQDGETVGVATIYPPDRYPPPLAARFALVLRGFMSVPSPTALGRWMKLQGVLQKRHPGAPHYYLEYLGVEPRLQGRGVGSLMLQRLAGWVDAGRIGCWVETGNPRNLPLYRRYGFEVVAKERVIGVNLWFMWRTPADDHAS